MIEKLDSSTGLLLREYDDDESDIGPHVYYRAALTFVVDGVRYRPPGSPFLASTSYAGPMVWYRDAK